MVVNGKIYAGTQNSLTAYGVLSPSSVPLAVSNAASGNASAVAPGSLVSVYGSNLSTSTATANAFPLPSTLGGASVAINGLAAPILYASPTQLNIQIPFQAPAGSATVTVSVNSAAIATSSIPIQASAPGLFTLAPGLAAVVNQNGLVNSQSQPAAVDSLIAAYLTGLGAVNPPVNTGVAAPTDPLSMLTGGATATIGSMPAAVRFAGLAPGFAGLYQVNIQVPQMSPGQYPLQISAGGVVSNAALVNIQ